MSLLELPVFIWFVSHFVSHFWPSNFSLSESHVSGKIGAIFRALVGGMTAERVKAATRMLPAAAPLIPVETQSKLARPGLRAGETSMVEFARRTHGLILRKNCATTPKCFSMFGSRLHSAAISENGPAHEDGGGISADGISCVLRR